MERVDLHLHTTASDGAYSPGEIVRMAWQRGLRAIAITDHDSTEGVEEALQATRFIPIMVIPGVEISTDIPKGEIHILGYYVDHRQPELRDILARLREGRQQRARKMVEKLNLLGMPISWERVQAIADGGAVGRPHVAKALMEAGYVASVQDAFALYIGREGPAYVERFKMTPAEAVALIARLGGLPVLAHPGTIPSLESWLPELLAAGLVGLEAYYTGYTAEMTAGLLRLAARHGLVATGGSDFHGQDVVPEAVLGEPPVPFSVVEELLARLA